MSLRGQPSSNMKQSDTHSQPIGPQNTFKRFERSVTRFLQRLGTQTAVSGEAIASPDIIQTNTFFQNAQGVYIDGNPKFHNIGSVTNVYGGGTDGLEKIEKYVSFDAFHDSSAQDPDRQCHPGTRENVLKQICDWIDNPNTSKRIFWLYGPAGAGKSAIAQTIAHLHDKGKVAATFFFFRSDTSRNNGNRLFTTIAWQLAFSIPATKSHIAHALSQRPHLPTSDVETQFDQLVAQPTMCASREVGSLHTAPVIIIDGIDECIDEKLQQRFLKVIGDAVSDDRSPLRFFIASRPELHIEHAIRRFQDSIIHIDLAKLDDANRDIEKFLVDQFSRIAAEQGLKPTWPGRAIIQDIVYKSSGNFIFASLVIKFIGDPDNIAETQLDIVLNMKTPTTMSPFAILDQLFLEILKRVPDQDFLKRYLVLLTARMFFVSHRFNDVHKDDAVLMHVSEKELHAKLRRLRSLLIFQPRIDVHHRSLLDFLKEPSRSSQYYIGELTGIRQYLMVFVDSLVRYVSTVIAQPNHHKAPHFAPGLRAIIKVYPTNIRLPVNEWQKLMQPLVDVQDKLLQLPNFTSTWDLLPCGKCTVFHLLRELLYLGILQGQPKVASIGGAESVSRKARKRGVGISLVTTNTRKNMNDNDLDSILLSLLAHLPDTMEKWLPGRKVIQLMDTILCFDCLETATRVRSVSDAQKLVDLLVYLIDEKNALTRIHPDATRKATLLALNIFARVPVLPSSISLNTCYNSHDVWIYKNIPIQILSQTLFAGRILDRGYIVPVFGIMEERDSIRLVSGGAYGGHPSIKQWRQRLIPSFLTVIQIMLQLAKAIQYLHEMGVTLYRHFDSVDVFLDSSLCPKIRCLCSVSPSLLDEPCKELFSLEANISSFGYLFHELFTGPPFSIDTSTQIPEYAWQLIHRCCAEDPENRPTIHEVVKEMECW